MFSTKKYSERNIVPRNNKASTGTRNWFETQRNWPETEHNCPQKKHMVAYIIVRLWCCCCFVASFLLSLLSLCPPLFVLLFFYFEVFYLAFLSCMMMALFPNKLYFVCLSSFCLVLVWCYWFIYLCILFLSWCFGRRFPCMCSSCHRDHTQAVLLSIRLDQTKRENTIQYNVLWSNTFSRPDRACGLNDVMVMVYLGWWWSQLEQLLLCTYRAGTTPPRLGSRDSPHNTHPTQRTRIITTKTPHKDQKIKGK